MHACLVGKERDELGVTVSGTDQLMNKVFLALGLPYDLCGVKCMMYDQPIQHTVSNITSGMAHSHGCKARRQ